MRLKKRPKTLLDHSSVKHESGGLALLSWGRRLSIARRWMQYLASVTYSQPPGRRMKNIRSGLTPSEQLVYQTNGFLGAVLCQCRRSCDLDAIAATPRLCLELHSY